jgi:hypothetical protein
MSIKKIEQELSTEIDFKGSYSIGCPHITALAYVLA